MDKCSPEQVLTAGLIWRPAGVRVAIGVDGWWNRTRHFKIHRFKTQGSWFMILNSTFEMQKVTPWGHPAASCRGASGARCTDRSSSCSGRRTCPRAHAWRSRMALTHGAHAWRSRMAARCGLLRVTQSSAAVSSNCFVIKSAIFQQEIKIPDQKIRILW